jgi:DNA-binding ferritin-like protein
MDITDYNAKRIQSLEKELTNAKNTVRRLEIQLSELKQRQRNRAQTARNRITELFLEKAVGDCEKIPWM